MSRSRDISKILGATELSNTTNTRLLASDEEVGLDSAQITTIASGKGLSVYTTLDSLPVQSLTAGDQAYVESDQRLYISNGNGWYNVALINLTPTMSLDQSGTITLSTEGVATTVTITAQDSDNPDAILSYSVESDGNGIGNYTLSQDSSVFTITPLSEDSGASTSTFTLTFKTTDNINTATSDLDFSLSFITIIDSSAETVLLMKADGNSATNAAITYQNSSDVSTGFTETGTPEASTFTPYRSGGYSAYFDGNGDFLSVPSSDVNIATLSASNFTVEGWFYKDDTTKNIFLFGQRGASGTSYSGIQLAVNISGYMALLGATDLVSWDVSITGSTLVTDHEWHHFAVVKNSTTYTLYLDGASQGTSTAGTLVYASGNPALVIGTVWSSSSSQYDWHGYIKDFRVSDNARYTTAFTPPTEPFESDSNTELLACSLPYFGDVSSTDATITQYGNISTRPFGPYDYEPWTANDHAGSVYFDGSGDYIDASGGVDFGTGDFTVEAWVRPTSIGNNDAIVGEWSQTTGYKWLFSYSGSGSPNGLRFGYDGGNFTTSTSTGVRYNTWHHVAVVRSSGTRTFYIDGTAVGSASLTANIGTSGNIRINAVDASSVFDPAGYVSEVRISDVARYTSAFTPPTAPLSHDSNTQLLMNNKSDANVYDVAASNRLTLVSASSSTASRKFATSSSISTNSGYVHLLETNDTNIFKFGTGDFCIEGWYYIPSGTQYVFFEGRDQQTQVAPLFYIYQSKLQLYVNGSFVAASSVLSNFAGAWCHLAMDRYNGSTKGYFNGTAQWTYSDSNNYVAATDVHFGSYFSASGTTSGSYIQDVRVTKGYSRYKGSNFTPPTAEFEL